MNKCIKMVFQYMNKDYVNHMVMIKKRDWINLEH